MFVVLDTNIVVSAFLSRKKGYDHSPSRQILNLVMAGRITACVCEEILGEYKEVLSRPQFNFNPEDVTVFINNFKAMAFVITPVLSTDAMIDEDDRVFFDTAQTAGALLVTGNIGHYPKSDTILTPAEFLGRASGTLQLNAQADTGTVHPS
jgi:putative PIN family toxin of toxin-antitoxin system